MVFDASAPCSHLESSTDDTDTHTLPQTRGCQARIMAATSSPHSQPHGSNTLMATTLSRKQNKQPVLTISGVSVNRHLKTRLKRSRADDARPRRDRKPRQAQTQIGLQVLCHHRTSAAVLGLQCLCICPGIPPQAAAGPGSIERERTQAAVRPAGTVCL